MLIVRGGRPLRGAVAVSGAKNAALPIMAAAIAIDGPVNLRGVPDLADVATLQQVLASLGVSVSGDVDNSMRLCVVDEQPCLAAYDLVRRMRASVCVLGPLLGRRRRACISLPGGCNIGHRPIDLHLKGLLALGGKSASNEDMSSRRPIGCAGRISTSAVHAAARSPAPAT